MNTVVIMEKRGLKMKENSLFKFRVWDEENKRFLDAEEFIMMRDGRVLVGNWMTSNDFSYSYDEPERFILMQSTGLKDINGVEIYESDILKHVDFESNEETVNVVYMKHGSLVFDVKIDKFVYDVPIYKIHQETSGGYEDTLEIIGNICETPELLGVE